MYAKVVNNNVVKFPYTMGDLYKDNPGTSFPDAPTTETLAAFGIYRVVQTLAPDVDSKTHRQIQSVHQVDGAWTQMWTTQQLPEEIAATNVRGFRNSLLAECDWTQLADSVVDKQSWANYRQALRDVTLQAGFPWNVQWPSKPA